MKNTTLGESHHTQLGTNNTHISFSKQNFKKLIMEVVVISTGHTLLVQSPYTSPDKP